VRPYPAGCLFRALKTYDRNNSNCNIKDLGIYNKDSLVILNVVKVAAKSNRNVHVEDDIL